MKKFFLTLLIGIGVAAGASYFGMQWKAQKSVEEFFSSMPFVEASYDSVKVSLEGELIVDDISLFVPLSQTTVDVGSVSIATGSLVNAMKMERDLQDGRLPTQLKLSINEFSVDIDPAFVSVMDESYESDVFSEVVALGCGRFASLGPQQLYDMGFRNLTFDLAVGYEYDMYTDVMVSTIDLYLDGIGNLTMDQTVMGMSGIIENYKSAAFGFDPADISTTEVHVHYADLGYVARQADFCARSAGMERKEWQQLNVSMFASLLEQIDFKADFDALNLYSKITSERARVDIHLRPITGFTAADFQLYSVPDLVKMLDFSLTVNDSEIKVGDISWDEDKWKHLQLADIRKEYRVGPQPEAEQASAEVEPVKRLERVLREVPARDLGQFVHRNVQITRIDGKVFTGEMTRVSSDRVVVRTRFNSGYTDQPLLRDEISVAKVYPED